MSGKVNQNTVYKFVPLGGLVVAVGAASVEITTLTVGATYRFSMVDSSVAVANINGGVACRFGTDDAAPTNGAFDFVVLAGESIDVVATNTTINFEELDAASDSLAAIYIAELQPDI